MIRLETRSFEARFGTHCPFCGRTWGDPSPCGDSRADWTIQDGLRLLFPKRSANCVVCNEAIPGGRKYCPKCSENVQRAKNREDRHRMVTDQCVSCLSMFERRSDKKKQVVCSRSCGMRVRRAREAAAA